MSCDNYRYRWGPQTVYKAKEYILKRLLNTAYTLDNLSIVNSSLELGRITVGVHIRLGDFYEIGLDHTLGL